jgi:hypothetical protein
MSKTPSKKTATILDRLEKTNQDGMPYERHHQAVNKDIAAE